MKIRLFISLLAGITFIYLFFTLRDWRLRYGERFFIVHAVLSQRDNVYEVFPLLEEVFNQRLRESPSQKKKLGLTIENDAQIKESENNTSNNGMWYFHNDPTLKRQDSPRMAQIKQTHIKIQELTNDLVFIRRAEDDFLESLSHDDLKRIWREEILFSDLGTHLRSTKPTLLGYKGKLSHFYRYIGHPDETLPFWVTNDIDDLFVEVTKQPGSIGFCNLEDFSTSKQNLKMIAIRTSHGVINPSITSFLDGTYPFVGRSDFLGGKIALVRRKSDTFLRSLSLEEIQRLITEPTVKNFKEINLDWPDLPPLIFFFNGVKSDVSRKAIVDGKRKLANFWETHDEEDLLREVVKRPGSIGFVGYSALLRTTEEVEAIGIEIGGKAIFPQSEEDDEGVYPFSGVHEIYTHPKAFDSPIAITLFKMLRKG